MSCAECGLENPPTQEACAFCEVPLAFPPERRAQWDALTPALRAEFSTAFERALQARREWRERLRRNRWRTSAAGGVFNILLMSITHGPVLEAGGGGALLYFALDGAAGAGAGFVLNAVRGSEYRGMILFGAWYGASTALKLATGALSLGLTFGLFVLFGFVVALCLGYGFGLNLSLRRSVEA